MLSKGMRSEELFNEVGYSINVKIEHPREIIYRWFWECQYLRLFNLSEIRYESDHTLSLDMNFTLSEAIDFIYSATPPLLQNKILESITTVDDIREVLKTFLFEDSAQQIYYQSKFSAMSNFINREHKSNIDKSYCDTIRRNIKTVGPIVHEKYKNKNGLMLCTFHANNKSELSEIVSLLDNLTGITPLNIKGFNLIDYIYDVNTGYYVDVYFPNIENLSRDMLDNYQKMRDRSYNWM